ncbi:MAG: hypothetical protein AAF531_03470 [Actinomycetota bacterium]
MGARALPSNGHDQIALTGVVVDESDGSSPTAGLLLVGSFGSVLSGLALLGFARWRPGRDLWEGTVMRLLTPGAWRS